MTVEFHELNYIVTLVAVVMLDMVPFLMKFPKIVIYDILSSIG
jgi:hypothetical protein